MKKILLITAVIASASMAIGQFTQGNEPEIGNTKTLYVIDSLAPDFESITGSGVEWDYSGYAGYGAVERTLQVVDPAITSFSSDFPSATKALSIQDFLVLFFSSSADERISYGFVFSEPSFGEILAKFNANPALQYEYPMDLNDEISDDFSGTLEFNLVTPMSPDAEGENLIKVDGLGTLKLANGVTYENVLRYRLEDEIIAEVDIFGDPQDFQLDRIQYEYYDLASSNLPIFVHATVQLRQVGAAVPIIDFSLVMSSEDPEDIVGVEGNQALTFGVYPNPADDIIAINVSNELINASYQIVDVTGRIVSGNVLETNKVSINISALEPGSYTIRVLNNGAVSTQKFIKK